MTFQTHTHPPRYLTRCQEREREREGGGGEEEEDGLSSLVKSERLIVIDSFGKIWGERVEGELNLIQWPCGAECE